MNHSLVGLTYTSKILATTFLPIPPDCICEFQAILQSVLYLFCNFMQDCNSSDPTSLLCLTPNVEQYRDLLSTERRKRDVTEPTSNITFLISLKLDGFEKYNETNFQKELPEFSEYTFVADPPAMKQWESAKEYKGGESMTVYGEEVSDSAGQNELGATQFYSSYVKPKCRLHNAKYKIKNSRV